MPENWALVKWRFGKIVPTGQPTDRRNASSTYNAIEPTLHSDRGPLAKPNAHAAAQGPISPAPEIQAHPNTALTFCKGVGSMIQLNIFGYVFRTAARGLKRLSRAPVLEQKDKR